MEALHLKKHYYVQRLKDDETASLGYKGDSFKVCVFTYEEICMKQDLGHLDEKGGRRKESRKAQEEERRQRRTKPSRSSLKD